jgi:hypothetical protein
MFDVAPPLRAVDVAWLARGLQAAPPKLVAARGLSGMLHTGDSCAYVAGGENIANRIFPHYRTLSRAVPYGRPTEREHMSSHSAPVARYLVALLLAGSTSLMVAPAPVQAAASTSAPDWDYTPTVLVNNTSKAWSVVWGNPTCYVSGEPSAETSWAVRPPTAPIPPGGAATWSAFDPGGDPYASVPLCRADQSPQTGGWVLRSDGSFRAHCWD